MKVRERDIGHRCTVAFDEEGHLDALLLASNPPEGWTVYLFADQSIENVPPNQIVEIGELIRPRL